MPGSGRLRIAAGAAAAYDPSDPQARRAIMASTGGVFAVCDFVGSEQSLQFCHRRAGARRQGGGDGAARRHILHAAAMFAIKAMTIEGTLTGTLAEARELLDLARSGQDRADPDA